MKRSLFILLASLVVLSLDAVAAQSAIGPSTLPAWQAHAQTKLGWVFVDPTDPGSTGPISGWEQYVGGTLPAWDYDAARVVYDSPAQWYIHIPNVDNDNPAKRFWICFVYERDPTFEQDRSFFNLDWVPFVSYENFVQNYEWFDLSGNPTSNVDLAVYERMTITVDMFPNPEYEDIWIGVVGTPPSPDGDSVFELLEAYVIAQCLECVDGADCDDSNQCTDDACVDSQCQHSCNATSPDDACCDNPACQGNPTCQTSTCTASAEASTFDTTPIHGASDLGKQLAYILLPIGAILAFRFWRRKR